MIFRLIYVNTKQRCCYEYVEKYLSKDVDKERFDRDVRQLNTRLIYTGADDTLSPEERYYTLIDELKEIGYMEVKNPISSEFKINEI